MCELLHTSPRGTRIFKADRLYAASLVTAEATGRAPLCDASDRVPRRYGRQWPQASRRSRGMPDPPSKSARSEVERRRRYSSANSGGARPGAFMSWPDRICTWRTLRSRSISIATLPTAAPTLGVSFDNLVSAVQDRRRYGQTERLGSLEVDDQLELGRLLDR